MRTLRHVRYFTHNENYFRGVFTFTNFSMLNNYFPRRFHFFDFFPVPNAYFNRNNHIYMIFGFRGIFTFANFSMLNNYFPRRFHFFDFFHVHNVYFNQNNHIFTIFGLFVWYELAPGRKMNILQKRPGAPKRSMYFCENAPERQNARCTWETLQIRASYRASCSLCSFSPCLGRAHTQPLLLVSKDTNKMLTL